MPVGVLGSPGLSYFILSFISSHLRFLRPICGYALTPSARSYCWCIHPPTLLNTEDVSPYQCLEACNIQSPPALLRNPSSSSFPILPSHTPTHPGPKAGGTSGTGLSVGREDMDQAVDDPIGKKRTIIHWGKSWRWGLVLSGGHAGR